MMAATTVLDIIPSAAPSDQDLVTVPFEGSEIEIPQNGVWFKPKGSGTTESPFDYQ